MLKKVVIYVIVGVGVVGGAFVAALYSHNGSFAISPKGINSGSNTGSSGDIMARSFSDPAFLDGSSDEVFVGRVIRQVGNERYPISGVANTQFDVRVIYNIKGNLQGTFVISQFPGGTKELQVGSTYTFGVKYNRDINWYTSGGDDELYRLLSSDASLSDADLKSLAEKDPWVIALQEAYPHEEIGLYALTNHIAYNSYASRRYDAQGNLIDDTVELAAGRSIPSFQPSSLPSQSAAPSPTLSPSDQRNAQRAEDLRQIQLALEQYFDKSGPGYPATLYSLIPKYMSQLPKDPQSGQAYQYSVDSKYLHDILAATLENPQSPLLNNNLHGMRLGINCDSPVYCMGDAPLGSSAASGSSSPAPAHTPPPPYSPTPWPTATPTQTPSDNSAPVPPPPPPGP